MIANVKENWRIEPTLVAHIQAINAELRRRTEEAVKEAQGRLRSTQNQHDYEQFLRINSYAEAAYRKIELLFPSDEEELRSALYWMANQGSSDDVPLLEFVATARRNDAPAVLPLMRAAIKEIRIREADSFLAALLRPGNSDRTTAAVELYRRGVWLRDGQEVGGTLTQAAENRMRHPESLPKLTKLLSDPDVELRCQIALVLSEWAGGGAVEAISAQLEQCRDKPAKEKLASHLVAALQRIGGPVAVHALERAALRASDVVRVSSITALEELASGLPVALNEGHPRFDHDAATSNGKLSPQVKELEHILRTICQDDHTPTYVRHRANEAMTTITHGTLA